MWHGMRVGPYRKAAGIKYPQYYAEKDDFAKADSEDKKHALYLYNCAQRAHGNFIENHAAAAIAMLVAGLRYPIASSVMGVGWSLCRLAYALGYTQKDRKDGKGRLIGSGFWLFQLGLIGLAGW
jgi:glutathione S-transferase